MQENSRKKILANFISLGVVQVINALLQLVVIPPVIARIGMAQYGVVAVAQVLMFYMATFTDYGFNQTATRDVSLNRSDNQALGMLFSKVYGVKILLCCMAFIVLLVLSLFFPLIRDHFSLYCMAFVFVVGYAMMPVWLLQGLERMHWLAFSTLAARIIFVVLVFVFINGPEDSHYFLFFFGAGNLIAGLVAVWLFIKKYKIRWVFPGFSILAAELRTGWPLTLTALSMNITQYGNIFILRLFTNDLVAGYFGVAERISFTMRQGLTIFSQAIYPEACRQAAAATGLLKRFLQRVFRPFILLVITGSVTVFLTAPWLILFFAGEKNPDAVFILRVFACVIPVIALNIPPSVALLAADQRKTYAGIFIAAMCINLALNGLLASYWKTNGTLAAICITEIFITAVAWIKAESLYKKNVSGRQPVSSR